MIAVTNEHKRLRTWYVSGQRAIELINPSSINARIRGLLVAPRGHAVNMELSSLLSPTLLNSVGTPSIPSLHELVACGGIAVGRYFALEARFRSSGLAATNKGPLVTLTSDVDGILGDLKLRLSFGKDGLTCHTAFSHLQGQPKVFVIGCISSINSGELVALPVVVADLVNASQGVLCELISQRLELRASDIDQFSGIDFTRAVSPKVIAGLKSIPEARVKQVLSEIFGELDPPKDWGGEECDLFSSNMIVTGRKCTAAFLLKGPAKFHEMTIADCGKNGDQIYRLFNTGADILVVQHCHRVSPAVRRTVEAFALAELRRDVRFLIIDGSDTARILRANGAL